MFKRLIKWGLRLLLLATVLAVILFLSLSSLLRLAIEHNIRKQTGMAAEIGSFHVGLTDPVVDIKNFQIYNTAQFGGTPFINIREIHLEYDPLALKKKEIHIVLLRLNLGELDIVKSRDGHTNIFELAPPAAKPGGAPGFKKQSGFEFKGIDCLNVSVGAFRYFDLQDPTNNRQQTIAVENCIFTNVTSSADLAGLGMLVGLRSGDFFKPMIAPKGDGAGGTGRQLLELFGF